MTLNEVPLSQVTLHPEVADEFRILAEVLPERFPSGTFSEHALLHLCQAHPIQVITHVPSTDEDPGEFRCVAGIRTFQLVKPRLAPTTVVPVLTLKVPPNSDIRSLATLDLFLGAVAFGIRGSRHGEQVAAMWQAIPATLMRKYCPPLQSKAAIARHLGWDPRALVASEKQSPGRKGRRA